jgi:hypothetical protein
MTMSSFGPMMTEVETVELAMPKFIIALVVAMTVTMANAENSSSGQSSPKATDADRMQPFLFDARLPGDEVRERAAHGRQPVSGTIATPPKVSQPQRER